MVTSVADQGQWRH